MTVKPGLSAMAKLHGAGLFLAGLGVLTQFLVGVPGFPKVPPGPIILGVAGVLVFTLAARHKWVLALSFLAALFIAIGNTIEGSAWTRVFHPGDFGPWIGATAQWVGLAIALVCGAAAIAQSYRGRRSPALTR